MIDKIQFVIALTNTCTQEELSFVPFLLVCVVGSFGDKGSKPNS